MLSQISRTSKVSVPIHVYKYKLFLNSDSSLSSQLTFTGLLASHFKRMASQCRSPLNPFRVWSLTTLSSLQCVRVCMCVCGPCIYTVWLCKRIYMKPVEQWSTSVIVSNCSFFFPRGWYLSQMVHSFTDHCGITVCCFFFLVSLTCPSLEWRSFVKLLTSHTLNSGRANSTVLLKPP